MSASLAPSLLADSVRLKPHVDSYRHVYQGRVWYVFHDRAAHRYYRVSGEGAALISALDGRRGVEQVLDVLRQRDGDAAPDAEQAAQFIRHLDALDLLQTEAVPDVAQLDARRRAMRRRRVIAALRTPLSFKLKLFDPTALLTMLLPWFGWIFGRFGAVLWLAVVAMGAVIGVMHWTALTLDATDRLLSTENLLLAGAVYPIVKVLHELGHGLALRRLGAEAREIGILFAAFIPVPYVDASAAAVLERRRDRMMVGAAGILVEMFIGSIALLLWSQAEPGALRAVCYNIIFISGFSTLLFNGNPLQRYDGYYILTDLVGIPGLGMRAGQYIGAQFRRHVIGDATAALPEASRTETWWFVIYGPASFIYRLSLMLVISFYVAERYPGLGLILAVWSVIGYLSTPLGGLVAWMKRAKGASARRGAIGLGLLAGGLAALLFLVPAPHAVMAQGVVAMPDEAGVRPQIGATVAELLVAPGARVTSGQPVARLDEPAVLVRLQRLTAHVAEMRARQVEASAVDVGRAMSLGEQLAQAQHELADAQRDVAALVVRSPADGTLLISRPDDLPGRFMNKGEAFATVWDPSRAVIRALAPMSDIAELRAVLRDHPQTGRGIAVRPGWDVMDSRDAEVVRLVPAASDVLPSAVLSLEGGGPFAVTHDRDNQLHTEEANFEVDLRTQVALPLAFLNGRMHVRFALPPEPVGIQLWRHVRLVFLRRLHA